MELNEIEKKVKLLIIDKLAIDEKDIVPEARFIEDLKADSLDSVELMMEFEKEFNITIPDTEMEKIKTVGEVIAYLDTHIKK